MKRFLILAICVLLLGGCEGMELESIHNSPLPLVTSSSLSSPLPEPLETPRPFLIRTPTPILTDRPVLTPTVPVAQTIVTYPTRSPEAQAAVEAARAFLADHLEISIAQIQLLYFEPKTWPDAGLGCPEPEQQYAQVVTPGYRVVLQVRTRQYELHTDRLGEQVVLCPGPVPGERVSLARARTQEAIVAAARQHLAERLGVSVEKVEVVHTEEAWWEDVTLGCPLPPGHYPDRAYPGPIAGYRIILAVEGVEYEYHSGGLWLVFCRQAGE